jgi:hypothetical protein
MTHGRETSQDDRKVEAQPGFDLSLLWLWPILLLQAMMETFAGHAVRLKALRKRNPRIADEDWAMHVENLRIGEWLTRAYVAREAQKLLFGEALDLADTLVPAAPPDWRRPEPRSPRELIGRLEALTRIHAHPLRYIERYARRLVATVLAADPRHAGAFRRRAAKAEASSASLQACAPCAAPAAPIASPWTRGIPAPP